jgi:hypothetical protein
MSQKNRKHKSKEPIRAIAVFDNGKINRISLRPKEIKVFNLEVNNALTVTDEIISKLSVENLKDKVVILKFFGVIERGKTSDIDFSKIDDFIKKRKHMLF